MTEHHDFMFHAFGRGVGLMALIGYLMANHDSLMMNYDLFHARIYHFMKLNKDV